MATVAGLEGPREHVCEPVALAELVGRALDALLHSTAAAPDEPAVVGRGPDRLLLPVPREAQVQHRLLAEGVERRLDESSVRGDDPVPAAGQFPDLPDALIGDYSGVAGQAVIHIPSWGDGERRGLLIVERA